MQIKKQVILLAMLLCGFTATWAAQKVTVATTQNGSVVVDKPNATAGETVTVTVTPAPDYQIAKSDIVVEATIDPGNAQVPGLKDVGPGVGLKIELQGDDPADLRTERTYTFTMPEAPLNVLITAHFSGVIEYNITISPDIVNGTVTSNKTTASYQETVTLTVTPAAGYEVATLQATSIVGGSITAIDPTPQGNGIYTFEMPARDVTIEATFTKKLYNIRIADEIENGSISAPATAYYGDQVNVTVTPDTGYELDKITYRYLNSDGTSSDAFFTADGESFIMPASDIIVTATFKLKKYNVEVEEAIDGDHGFVQAVPSTCSMGETVTLITSADTGYAITTLQATYEEGTTEVNLPLTPAENDTYTFVMPAADVHVHWIVSKVQYIITVNPSEHGTVTAPATAEYGQEVTLTVTPDAHYMLESLSVAYTNGNPVTVTDNKFTMPAANVVVNATFKPVTYNITVAPTEHGTVTAPESAAYGSEVTVSVAPEEAYELETLTYTVDGGQPVPIENGKFTMPGGNVTITATFKPATYTITVAPTEHGTVSAPATAAYGTEVNVTVTPDPGYEIDELYYTYDAGGSVPDPIFRIENGKFVMPGTNVTIVATFKAQVFNITTSVYPNDEAGSITVASSAAFGSEVEVTATPAAGYTLKQLYYTYDVGGSVPDPIFEIEDGKFTMPGTDITVVAEFELAPEPEHTYTVVGEPAALFGSETPWDVNNSNGEMTAGDGGIYTWTSQPTHLEGDVMFKIVTDKNWNNPSYPADNYIISNVKPGTYTVTITLNPATGEINVNVVGQADVFVIGQINGNTQFAPNDGLQMTTEDGKIYTAQVTIDDIEAGYGFFAFTHKLGANADDWSTVNAYRFMAESYYDFLVTGSTMNSQLPIDYKDNSAMKIPAGEYTLTVDLENMYLTINGGTQLSYILAQGVEGVDYTVINDLAVVERHADSQQFFTSDGSDNWITIKGGSFFADAVLMEALKGGHVSGVFSGKNLNPYLTLTVAPVEGEGVSEVEPKVYLLSEEFAPMVDEVIVVKKAYYKASENTLRAYAPGGAQGQSLTVDTSLFNYDFRDGYSYTVTGVINIKEPWATNGGKGLMDYDFPFQNYTLLVLDAEEIAPPTAINGIFVEDGVKSVRFYNAAGVESNVPFQGINIVVKEMNDGSKVTTKAIIK